MSLSLEEREELIAAADEARDRRRHRRFLGGLISVLAMIAVIVVAVVLTIGFENSWWVEKRPVASSDQRASDGSSVFTQAGIDYFTKEGVLRVTMGAEQPTAAELGLPASGTRHIDLLVPVTVALTGTGRIDVPLIPSLDVTTEGGSITTVELPYESSYHALIQQVQELAPKVGWSASAVASFQSALEQSRAANGFTAYSATIGPSEHDGMRISGTLSADAQSGPTLVVSFRPIG